jgi:prolyl-tRNA editing enzyme YbaK/EbsC (Cys-tRNA(Pro) deacylase)
MAEPPSAPGASPDGPRGERDIAAAVLRHLAALGAPFEVLECDPAYADTVNFATHYGIPMEQSANCIIVGSKREPRRYCACLALATTRVDVNRTVKRLLDAGKLSFAPPEETTALTGMLIGGVTPFALPEELPLYIDRRVLDLERVSVGGGSRSQKIAVPPEVFTRLPGAQVVDGLAVEVAGTAAGAANGEDAG